MSLNQELKKLSPFFKHWTEIFNLALWIKDAKRRQVRTWQIQNLHRLSIQMTQRWWLMKNAKASYLSSGLLEEFFFHLDLQSFIFQLDHIFSEFPIIWRLNYFVFIFTSNNEKYLFDDTKNLCFLWLMNWSDNFINAVLITDYFTKNKLDYFSWRLFKC